MSRTNKIFLYLLYFALVAVLSGFIITSSKTSPPKVSKAPAPLHSRPQKAPAPPKPPVSPTASKPKPAAGGAGAAAASGTAASTASPLANSGPGDTAGLFVAASLAGMALHRRRLVKRAG